MKNLLKLKVFICTAILLLSIVNTISAQKIAIIDAGSSGSRLWVYKVTNDSIEVVLHGDSVKGPALTTINADFDSVVKFLTSMVEKYHNGDDTISLYVLATAGMRMVPEKAENIYAKMNRPRKEKVLINGFRLDTAMTISGQYEGYYAWIAANVKAGKLKIEDSKDFLSKTTDTNGILEIGGASMQVAFLTDSTVANDIVYRKGLGKIYSKSYLHYGVDRIFEQLGSFLTPNCLPSLEKIETIHCNNMQFWGLSRPIENVFNKHTSYSFQKIRPDITEMNEKRKDDRRENYHPATNAIYIDWIVSQLSIGNRLYISKDKSDWTEGAALDILIYKKEPQKFEYRKPN